MLYIKRPRLREVKPLVYHPTAGSHDPKPGLTPKPLLPKSGLVAFSKRTEPTAPTGLFHSAGFQRPSALAAGRHWGICRVLASRPSQGPQANDSRTPGCAAHDCTAGRPSGGAPRAARLEKHRAPRLGLGWDPSPAQGTHHQSLAPRCPLPTGRSSPAPATQSERRKPRGPLSQQKAAAL